MAHKLYDFCFLCLWNSIFAWLYHIVDVKANSNIEKLDIKANLNNFNAMSIVDVLWRIFLIFWYPQYSDRDWKERDRHYYRAEVPGYHYERKGGTVFYGGICKNGQGRYHFVTPFSHSSALERWAFKVPPPSPGLPLSGAEDEIPQPCFELHAAGIPGHKVWAEFVPGQQLFLR